MSVDRAAASVHSALWTLLRRWFRVPAEPPPLPHDSAHPLLEIHPSAAFLRYLKLKFWIGLTAVDGVIAIVWLALAARHPDAALVLLAPALVVAIVPDIVVYVALQLRYDSTWYVMSGRSLRLRRGIWVLRELTITFENVQNIKVTQGPLMRYFGIKNLVVETAGGTTKQGPEGPIPPPNQAVLEGLDNADEIRDLIMARVRASRFAGLGDESAHEAAVAAGAASLRAFTPAQVELLREIRDAAASLAP